MVQNPDWMCILPAQHGSLIRDPCGPTQLTWYLLRILKQKIPPKNILPFNKIIINYLKKNKNYENYHFTPLTRHENDTETCSDALRKIYLHFPVKIKFFWFVILLQISLYNPMAYRSIQTLLPWTYILRFISILNGCRPFCTLKQK